MNRTAILDAVKKCWFYAGEWHEAECSFILHDQGVCNCNHNDIKKQLKQALLKARQETIKEMKEEKPIFVAKGGYWLDSKRRKFVYGPDDSRVYL